MRKVGERLSRHLNNILTFCQHRIANVAAEGLGSKLMVIMCRACGYRNRERFKAAIYFCCDGLNLYSKRA